MNLLFCRLAALAVVLNFSFSAVANDAGSGTNGLGANVTLSVSGTTAMLANGVITATIDTTSGTVTSHLFNGGRAIFQR